MDLKVIPIEYGSDKYEEFLDFRDYYFRKPQGLSIRDDDLSGDKISNMYAWYDDNGRIQATILYLPGDNNKAQIRGVITSDDIRGQGYGRMVMEYAEQQIKNDPAGYTGIVMDARVVAQDFYHHMGYKTVSPVYDIASIPHIKMEKDF